MKPSLRAFAIVGTTAVLALTACDSGTSASDDSAESATSRKAFTRQVDGICQESRDRIEPLQEPGSLKEASGYLDETAAIAQDQLEKIEEMEVPPDGRDDFERWIGFVKQDIQALRQMSQAASEGDAATFQQLSAEQRQLDDQADKAATVYGFQVCGQGDAAESDTETGESPPEGLVPDEESGS